MVRKGSDISLTCSVQMNQNILSSELSLLMVTAQLIGPDGSVLTLYGPEISGTNFIYTARVDSFGDSDAGNYTCNVTIRPRFSLIFLSGVGQLVSNIEIGIQNGYNCLALIF